MPKRINNVFKENITFSKLLEAHNKCKKNKRYKKQVIEFEMNLERNIISLGRDLISDRYKFSEYFEFTIYEPKERKIKTLNYKDRVILCWYVENFLKLYFKPNFIEDSYACLEGKGTHKAIVNVNIKMYIFLKIILYKIVHFYFQFFSMLVSSLALTLSFSLYDFPLIFITCE